MRLCKRQESAMSVEKRTTDAIAIMAGGASALEKL